MEELPGATWCWALGLQAGVQGPNQRGRRSRYGGVDLVMVMDSFGGGVVGGRIAGGGVLSLAQGLLVAARSESIVAGVFLFISYVDSM